MAEVIPTRLESFRAQKSDLCGEACYELKDTDGKIFKPNLFANIVDDGLKVWSEDGGSVVLPDGALKALKTRLTYLTGKVT